MESLLIAVATGVGSFIGSWAAFRIELKYLRRDVDHAHKRLDDHEANFHFHKRAIDHGD